MFKLRLLTLSIITLMIFLPSHSANILRIFQHKPPVARYQYSPQFLQHTDAVRRTLAWNPDDGTNVWEESGLYEGDIMIYHSSQLQKNGLTHQSARWPNGIIPYYISESFSNGEAAVILQAMEEYHNRTCIRFRPYRPNDHSWIELRSDDNGCWSSVGMQSYGQVVNLNSPGCVYHGVVVHELMHAVGFYHQQSASDRDYYVQVNWENIFPGNEHNFNKYDPSVVTDFGVPYDYESVMHYSANAFTRNGLPTITPLQSGVVLGQRYGLSEKDVLKINAMYSNVCAPSSAPIPIDHLQIMIKWMERTIGL